MNKLKPKGTQANKETSHRSILLPQLTSFATTKDSSTVDQNSSLKLVDASSFIYGQTSHRKLIPSRECEKIYPSDHFKL